MFGSKLKTHPAPQHRQYRTGERSIGDASAPGLSEHEPEAVPFVLPGEETPRFPFGLLVDTRAFTNLSVTTQSHLPSPSCELHTVRATYKRHSPASQSQPVPNGGSSSACPQLAVLSKGVPACHSTTQTSCVPANPNTALHAPLRAPSRHRPARSWAADFS